MYHKQAGHMSRPPSPRPTPIPLSIRTTTIPSHTSPQQQGRPSSSSQRAPQQRPPSSSSSQQYPSYPISISSEKFPKALKLYSKYYLVKGLSQQESQSAIEPHKGLSIPNVKRAHSLSSPGSSRAYAPSVSDSAYDGVTESVVSFTGEESPGSATANGSTELISFTGERVRQRIRRPLTPVTKAKAALIRHLESCWVCRSRRVPCPLKHHDIDSLEKARQARARTRQRAQSVQQFRSSDATFPNVASADQPNVGGSQGQMTSLLGVGGGVGHTDQFQETPSFDNAHTDSKSTAVITETETDLLTEIHSHPDVAGPANLAIPAMPTISYSDPFATYQNSQIFPLGVLSGLFFVCAHADADGLCHHPFEDAEALQSHFESHFSYNRIAPAQRYVCSYCQGLNSFSSGLCYYCGNENTIEVWIYGSYISVPTYQRYGPDGEDFLRNTSRTPFFPLIGGYGMGNIDFGLGGMNNGNFTTGDMNQGGGYYNFQNNNNNSSSNNNFEGPSSQGDNGDGYNTPRSGGYPPANWTQTRNRAKANPLTARYWHAKYRHYKLFTLILLLLAALTVLFKTHKWVLKSASSLTPISQHSNLPVFGFVGFLASFAMCYTYWSVKKVGVQRFKEAQSVSSFRERGIWQAG